MDSKKLRYSLVMLAARIASETLDAGDVIVVIGQREDMKRMNDAL